MFQIPVEDLIEEVKAEIICYEDEDVANRWEKTFREKIKLSSHKKQYIKQDSRGIHYILKDEGEVFSMADSYVSAICAGEEEKYWRGF